MAKKKYKIAFSGVFDLANYGDHLFPIVFEAMMKKKGLDFELYLFSPIACKEALNENDTQVYALSDMERMHLRLHFDAIIVAGGEIIHFSNAMQKLKINAQRFEEYPIFQTWIVPSLLSYKYNIRLIWNAPGAHTRFSKEHCHLAKALCDSVDYLSVRNPFSKEILLECGVPDEKITVVPDSALQISQIVDLRFLNQIKEKLIDFKDKYVVFHTNRFIKEDEISIVVSSLNNLIEQGYKIVLLPLAYTHGDETILHRINQQANNIYIEFDKILSAYEMMSVLAGCTLYIGVSFHGAITALSYGKKAIAYDFMHYKKTEDLYHSLNIERYYINDAKDL